MKGYQEGFWILLCVLMLLAGCVIYDFGNVSGNAQARVIGVTSMTLNNPFYEVINNELRKITEANGDQLLILDPMLSARRQEEQIEQMIEQDVDAIILNPVNSSTLEVPLRKAKEAGIPVVVMDSSVQHKELIDTTIVSDNYLAGKLCARAVMDEHEQANILLLEHNQADSARDRINGFLEEISGHPQYQVVNRRECEGQLELAMPATAEALSMHPEINVIMALNDPSALGAAAAADLLGRKDLSIYGVDGTPDFKTRMEKDTVLKATVAQSPYSLAKKAAESVYALLDNKTIPSMQIVNVELITQDNLTDFNREGWQ